MLSLKKLLKVIVVTIMVLVITYAVGRFVVVFKDSWLSGQRAPYIQMLTSDSVIIRWMTEKNELGIVQFGEDSELLSSVELESSATKNHSLKLTKLKPATKYYYRTGTISGSPHNDIERQWFYTSPADVVPTRIWVMGDSGQVGDTLTQVRDSALDWMRQNPLQAKQAISEQVISEKVVSAQNVPSEQIYDNPLINVWLALGDIAYSSGTNEQYQSALFDPFAETLANTALWPIYGNHDDRRWTYFRIFDLPENAEAGGIASQTENYYSIDYSNIHFVILDSQASDRASDGEMADWLRRDLAQNKKPWVIAAFHHPPYTKGSHDSDSDYDSRGRMQDMRENILPILEAEGVDLVLTGHSHMYERSYLLDCAYGYSESFVLSNIVSAGVKEQHRQYLKPLNKKKNQGAVYMVAGSSSKVDKGPLNHPAHFFSLAEAGSVVIDVDGDLLTTRFIDNKGQVRDQFSISKLAGYESGYKGCVTKTDGL